MQIIILAAGHGTRMKSELPKVMHEVAGIPMIERVINNCQKITKDLVLIYSKHLEPYLDRFKDKCTLVEQKEQLGTAHAVSVAESKFDNNTEIGVIYGDNPLITSEIIENMFNHLRDTNSKALTLVFECKEPNQYGRIIVDEKGNFKKIVEAKFASEEQKKITLCNSGIMAFAPGILEKHLKKCLIPDNNLPDKELYLTDIIEHCTNDGDKVSYYKAEKSELVIGVNTQDELKNANLIAHL